MAAMGAVSTSGRFECAGFVKLWLVQGLQLFVRLILKPLSIPLSLSLRLCLFVCLSVCSFVCIYLFRALSLALFFDVVVSLLFVCGSGSSSMLVGSWVARCVDSSI